MTVVPWIAIIAVAGSVFLFRNTLWDGLSSAVNGLLSLLKLNAFPPVGAYPEQQSPTVDVVDCSIFAPPTAPPGKSVFVQVFLHAPAEMDRAEMIATKIDPGARLRSIATLQAEVARGQRVAVTLDCPEVASAEVSREIVWRGHPQAVSFRVAIPAGTPHGREFVPVVRVSVEGAPVGYLEFSMTCQDADLDEAHPTGKDARRYKYAFLSYASQDRTEVTKFARALNAARIDFFQDFIKLRSGEDWEQRLYEELDKCDVLYLFWSRHAAASSMVQSEAEYAYGRASRSGKKVPDITPIRLDGSPLPTNPPHPAWMTKIHFDDYFRRLIED